MHVAGKPVLGHILDSIKSLGVDEIVFITGDMEDQIVEFVDSNYKFKTSFIKQKKLLGDGYAINMASKHVKDDVIVVFVDTLFVRDIKKDIKDIGSAEGIVWTSKTEDPRRFGIAEVSNNIIKGVEEKARTSKVRLSSNWLILFQRFTKNVFIPFTGKKEEDYIKR